MNIFKKFKHKLRKSLTRKLTIPLMDEFFQNIDLLVRRNNFTRKKSNKDFFLWDAREFLYTNGITGDYYEFGISRCRTFAKAMRILSPQIKHFYGFDSFQGMPQPKPGDEHPTWTSGVQGMKSPGNAQSYTDALVRRGFDKNSFNLIEGFFEKTLPSFTPANKAGVLFIDCDYISSLQQVLEFIPRVLQEGTLVYFDDFFCYKGSPLAGQQKAFADFCSQQSDFQFAEYNNYPPFAKVFIAYPKK